jgi:thioredoxin-related protein
MWLGAVVAAMGLTACSGEKAVESAGTLAAWKTSFEEAKAEAASRKVPILADFSGSDWCGWCVRLEKEVFSKAEFKEYAEKNLVLLLVDFPRGKAQGDAEKKQNRGLAETFGIEGFPTVLLLDAEGKELGRTGYRSGGAAAYVEHLKSLIKK